MMMDTELVWPRQDASALIVSRDAEFADDLRNILHADHQLTAHSAVSYAEAAALLNRNSPGTVFLDLRGSTGLEDPTSLLQHMAEWSDGRVPVVAISDSGYVCDWAAIADLIVSGHLLLPLDRAQLARLMEVEPTQNSREMSPTSNVPKVVCGKSITWRTYTAEMADLLENAVMMAAHDVTLLLVGETGTGKTTLARLIHELSPRNNESMLTLACGAIPQHLIESELFGHVKGAFTSADHSKVGKFEAVGSGSLLLDEIDVLTPDQQVKLLRVIESGDFEPVGSNETREFRARLIVASNVDLKQLMERNAFRADLYYRLSVLEFHLPALRDRPRDIVPMALDFIEELSQQHGVCIHRVHPDFLTCLKSYDWPGNIRELKNYVRRAVLFCRTGELSPNDLTPHLLEAIRKGSESARVQTSPQVPNASLNERVAASEKAMLEEALRKHNNNRTATAKALGLSRVGLYKKMHKYGMMDRHG